MSPSNRELLQKRKYGFQVACRNANYATAPEACSGVIFSCDIPPNHPVREVFKDFPDGEKVVKRRRQEELLQLKTLKEEMSKNLKEDDSLIKELDEALAELKDVEFDAREAPTNKNSKPGWAGKAVS